MTERTKIDARGAYCPGPLMELIAALKLVEIGDEVEEIRPDRVRRRSEIDERNRLGCRRSSVVGRSHPTRKLVHG